MWCWNIGRGRPQSVPRGVPAEVEVVLLQEPGLPRGNQDIIDAWHLIHDARTSTCPPPAVAMPRPTWAITAWTRTSRWASMIATKDDNNVWVFISVYMPCTGRCVATFIEATNEIEVTVMEAPPHAHMIIGRRLQRQLSQDLGADGATIGSNIIERDVPYCGHEYLRRTTGADAAAEDTEIPAGHDRLHRRLRGPRPRDHHRAQGGGVRQYGSQPLAHEDGNKAEDPQRHHLGGARGVHRQGLRGSKGGRSMLRSMRTRTRSSRP